MDPHSSGEATMNLQLESSLITAFAAILGTVAGGFSTFATTVFLARHNARRDMLLANITSRETLYSDFIKEATTLYIDSLDKSLGNPATLLNLLASIGRIRLVSSDRILAAAEKIGEEIYASYKRPALTIEEAWAQHHDATDPLKEFTEACREEREKMLRTLTRP
jgi:hypothetical protein